MGGKTFTFILTGVVIFLTLAISLLAGYLFFVGVPTAADKATIIETKKVDDVKIPSDSELSVEPLSKEKTYYNLRNDDPEKISVIELQMEIIYYNKVKGIAKVSEKIGFYKSQINELVSTYFENMTIEDVKAQNAKENAKKELTKSINEILNVNEPEKVEIVYTVVFGKWFYQ